MDYKTLNNNLKLMGQGDKFEFTYQDKTYSFSCYDIKDGTEKYFSVGDPRFILGQSMNVDKITSKYVTLYSFNMMSQKTTYKIPIEEMQLVEEEN